MAGKRSDIYRHFRVTEQDVPAFDPARTAHFPDPAQLRIMADAHLRMIADLAARIYRRKPPGTAAAPIPADPRKPNTLTGGAAAALDFD